MLGLKLNHVSNIGLLYSGFFVKEVNQRLAKRPLKTNWRLANRWLTSLVKEAIVGSLHLYTSGLAWLRQYQWSQAIQSNINLGFVKDESVTNHNSAKTKWNTTNIMGYIV